MSADTGGRRPVTSVMIALAWAVLHGPEDWTVARTLARQVIDASERQGPR